MNSKQLIALASSLLALMLILPGGSAQQPQLISCYNCTAEKASDNCGTPVPGLTPTTQPICIVCSTYINTINGYGRGCVTGFGTPGCNNNVGQVNSQCNCDGASNCNTELFRTLGDFTCYTCSSAGGIDNGCGAELDENSRHVSKATGCTACTKEITSLGAYVRGCSRAIESSDGCYSGPGSSQCYLRCKSDLCNTAARFDSTNAMVLVALLAARILLANGEGPLDDGRR